jgi:hypothetical protein
VSITREMISQLATAELENFRSSRYRADDLAIGLDSLGAADRELLVWMYETLRELEGVVTGGQVLTDPAPLVAFVERHDVGELVARVRRIGAQAGNDEHLAAIFHDIRGGALSALITQLSRVGRGDLARAFREFAAQVGDERVVVEVDCQHDAVIAESCVELGAIDRVAYNLLNNAVRHTQRPTIDVWLLRLEKDLCIAFANTVSAAQRDMLAARMAEDPAVLFGDFTTTDSGYGLRIVAELVGHAYGVPSVQRLAANGYVGAKIVGDSFVTWFHWPTSDR